MTSGRTIDPGIDALQVAYARLRHARDTQGGLSLADRRAALKALRRHLVARAEDYVRAADGDFGRRSRHETLLTEVSVALSAIDHALLRLARWSRPTPVRLGFPYWPARAYLLKQPRGLVGIISPGNYPLQLAIVPLINALSAGCRALVKPSEATPRVSALLAEGVAAALDPDIAAVVTGGREVAAALAKTPLDLLLFTGSPQTGAMAREAAASAGSPLVLELGGKSPTIIGDGADLDRAAAAIVAGKLINAGQTCVAPDYLLTPRRRLDETIRALREQAVKLYPTPRDLTALASPQAVERIARLAAGQSTIDLLPCPVEPPLVAPRLVIEPALDSAIMREEIFGPLLPVVGYDTIDDAITIVNGRPDPLALYWFGPTGAAFEALTARTRSGSIAIDDTVIQAGVHEIAFGGIGASGVGRYHGKAGFDTFTHERPVFRQARFNLPSMLRPPFGKLADRILGRLIR